MNFLVQQNRIKIHGYVIMPNHIHLIISICEPHQISNILRDFHKFTSQQIIKIFRNENNPILNKLLSEKKDRKYQIWQTTHAIKEIESHNFYVQKLEYIHNNPCQDRWQLCENPENYFYSSAKNYILNQESCVIVEKIE